jgi:mono/diheme cytochrome c family protein
LKSSHLIRYLAPFTIVVIIIIFIVNVVTHGSIQHPGKSSYQSRCADCHGEKGEGIRALVPPLYKSDFALQHFDSIPCWLKNGMSHPITVNGKEYDQPMYGLEMDAIQIANVMNYISQEMLGSDKTVTSLQVKKRMKECK